MDEQPENQQQTKQGTSAQDEADAQIAAWKEKYLRAIADYQNLRKRTDEEKQEVRMFAGRVVIEKLLPVVDMLEKAKQHLNDQGLALAMKEFHGLLGALGVEQVDAKGKVFDPMEMDCVEVVDGKEQDIVVSVVSPGYRMHGVTIRPAKVAVGAVKEQNKKEEPAE